MRADRDRWEQVKAGKGKWGQEGAGQGKSGKLAHPTLHFHVVGVFL